MRYDVRVEPECLRLMGLEDLAKTAGILDEMDNATLRQAVDRIGQATAARTIVHGGGRETQFRECIAISWLTFRTPCSAMVAKEALSAGRAANVGCCRRACGAARGC